MRSKYYKTEQNVWSKMRCIPSTPSCGDDFGCNSGWQPWASDDMVTYCFLPVARSASNRWPPKDIVYCSSVAFLLRIVLCDECQDNTH